MKALPDRSRPFARALRSRPFVLGHRGARNCIPENTLLSFERALEEGADGVELDVRMSTDGELFIAHDDQIQLKGRQIALHCLSSAQIRQLETQSGLPVPTLRQVLQMQARTGAYFNIELKGDVPSPLWMARRTADLLLRHGGAGVVLSSFHPGQVALLARALPEVPVGQLFESGNRLLESCRGALGAVAVHPQFSLLSRDLIALYRRRGWLVNTWTVNHEDDAKRLASWGVDAIITDEPARILRALCEEQS